MRESERKQLKLFSQFITRLAEPANFSMSLLARIKGLLASGRAGSATTPSLDYDQLIHLDAEDLAEGGILKGYEALRPALERYVANPIAVKERLDDDGARYSVFAVGEEHVIYAPDLDEPAGGSWARAACALFRIVNMQLEESSVRLYAINGGNDLGGMFLTAKQVEDAKKSLKRKQDWPYFPTNDPPWFGEAH